jgi:hypothetical protein
MQLTYMCWHKLFCMILVDVWATSLKFSGWQRGRPALDNHTGEILIPQMKGVSPACRMSSHLSPNKGLCFHFQ